MQILSRAQASLAAKRCVQTLNAHALISFLNIAHLTLVASDADEVRRRVTAFGAIVRSGRGRPVGTSPARSINRVDVTPPGTPTPELTAVKGWVLHHGSPNDPRHATRPTRMYIEEQGTLHHNALHAAQDP